MTYDYLETQIHDTKDIMVIKTFTTETPLNSAALASNRPYVCSQSLADYRMSSTWSGPIRRRSRGDERYNDVVTPGQIRDEILAQGIWRRGWASQGPFRSHQYVGRHSWLLNKSHSFRGIGLLSTRRDCVMPLAEKMGLSGCTTMMNHTSKLGHTVTWRLSIKPQHLGTLILMFGYYITIQRHVPEWKRHKVDNYKPFRQQKNSYIIS